MDHDPSTTPLAPRAGAPMPRSQGPMSSGPGGPTQGPWQQPAAPIPSPRPPRRRTGALLAAAAAIALIFGVLGGAIGGYVAGRETEPTSSAAVVESIADKALPSVVTIRISDSSGSPIGTGSGFVLRADGYIVTNSHVATAGGRAEKLTVLFSDQSEADAKIVGNSPTYDLAVLKVDRSGLPVLTLGDSATLKVGQSVVAVGAPLGLTGSVTTGIVSAVNRPVVTGGGGGDGGDGGSTPSTASTSSETSYMNAIQTDAAINHGNSGGPLLDLQGRVIGVNSAIYSSRGGGSIGLGFAIPAAQVARTTDQIIRTGKAEYPDIGVEFVPDYAGSGVKVSKVAQGGPADGAGVKENDVITSIDGTPTKDPKTFLVTLRSKAIGATITLGLRSGDTDRTVTMQTRAAS